MEVFFAIFEKDFKKNAAVVKKVILLEFVKVCFVNAFGKHAKK